MKWWAWILIGFFISCLIGLSIYYDLSVNGDFLTIVGGLWSAVATAVLGFIAIWQNKRYKQLSEERAKQIERLTQTAECCYIGSTKDFVSCSKPYITIGRTGCADDHYHLIFTSLTHPMIAIKIINCSFNDSQAGLYCDNLTSIGTISYLPPLSEFCIGIMFPDELSGKKVSCDFFLEYENMYGSKITKKVSVDKQLNNGVFSCGVITEHAEVSEVK